MQNFAKNITTLSLLAIIILTAGSCRKQNEVEKLPVAEPVTPRQVRLSLFTNKDFSNDPGTVQFTATIRNASRTLWDSIMPPMKIKDIPAFANKLVIEKTVPGNDSSQLSVGFIYYIQNVGVSWYLESFDAGKMFKAVDYHFQ